MKIKSISEICLIRGGKPAPKGEEPYENGTIPFVKMQDLGRYHLTTNLIKTRDKLNAKFVSRNHYAILKKGTILIPRSGSVSLNHRAILGVDACIVSHICALETIDVAVDKTYLYYALCGVDMKHIMKKTTGLDAITFQDLGKIKIPIPDILIQKQIVSILERAEKLKKKREEANEETNKIIQSLFYKMFGDPVNNEKNWNISKIGEFAQVKTGGTPSRKNPSFYGDEIPWVKTTEVKGSVIYDTEEKITKDGLENSNCEVFPIDTIIIAMYGQGLTRGRSARLGIRAATNQACAAILPSNKFNVDYLFSFINLSYRNIRSLGRGGNQPNLNLSIIKSFPVILPPIEFQNQFGKVVKQIESIKGKQKQSTQAINTLFDALMQKAFNGELVK